MYLINLFQNKTIMLQIKASIAIDTISTNNNSYNGLTHQIIWFDLTHGDYTYITSFGCLSDARVDTRKLELRAIKCVFIWYNPSVIGHKLWSFNLKNFIISRDYFWCVWYHSTTCKIIKKYIYIRYIIWRK